jgi:hypothetical protein
MVRELDGGKYTSPIRRGFTLPQRLNVAGISMKKLGITKHELSIPNLLR